MPEPAIVIPVKLDLILGNIQGELAKLEAAVRQVGSGSGGLTALEKQAQGLKTEIAGAAAEVKRLSVAQQGQQKLQTAAMNTSTRQYREWAAEMRRAGQAI